MKRILFLAVAIATAGAALCACSSKDSGTIRLITDDDAGTFTQSPAPTKLQIVAVESADASTVLATAALPASTLDLGEIAETTSAVSLNVRGLDDTGALRVFGASLPFEYAALAGQTIPVFVQRTGAFARLPGPLADARTAPSLSVIQGQYLIVGGGAEAATAPKTAIFDFGAFTAFPSPPTLPVAPQSIAFAGTIAWLVNEAGGTYFDFSNSGSLTIAVPSGGTFADVAGGTTIGDAAGAQYIVGATRTTGAPTRTVLKIDPGDTSDANYPYGKPTWLQLATARTGAAAAWVDGAGLVVAGGLGADVNASVPLEVIAPGTALGVARPLALGGAFGGGAAALDAQRVVLAGGVSTATLGDAGVRVVDLGCTPTASATCVTAWTGLPVTLASAQAFSWTATEALVVGNAVGNGATRVFRLGATSTTEVATRSAHRNARATWSPVGSIVLFGGSNVLESFTP